MLTDDYLDMAEIFTLMKNYRTWCNFWSTNYQKYRLWWIWLKASSNTWSLRMMNVPKKKKKRKTSEQEKYEEEEEVHQRYIPKTKKAEKHNNSNQRTRRMSCVAVPTQRQQQPEKEYGNVTVRNLNIEKIKRNSTYHIWCFLADVLKYNEQNKITSLATLFLHWIKLWQTFSLVVVKIIGHVTSPKL